MPTLPTIFVPIEMLFGKSKSELDRVGKATARFRGELLSMFFIGRQVVSFFSEYVGFAKQISGENEVLTTSIGAAVAEFREFLGLDKVAEFFSDLADTNPLLVGGFVQLATWAGVLLGVLAQIGLIMEHFPAIWEGISRAAPIVGRIFSVLAGVFMLIKGVYGFFVDMATPVTIIKNTLLIIGGIAALVFAVFGGWIPAVIAIGAGIISWATKFQPVKDAIMWIWGKLKDIGDIFANLVTGNFVGIKAAFKRLFGLAEGGIVTRPTAALIGERGPEAVIPLNRLANFAPNVTIHANVSNNIDMRRLADQLSTVYQQQLLGLGLGRRIG
jgi:hypothetical protein